MTKNFLDYLYTQLMIDLAVLDAIYEAAEAGEPCEYRTEILEWFEENIAR